MFLCLSLGNDVRLPDPDTRILQTRRSSKTAFPAFFFSSVHSPTLYRSWGAASGRRLLQAFPSGINQAGTNFAMCKNRKKEGHGSFVPADHPHLLSRTSPTALLVLSTSTHGRLGDGMLRLLGSRYQEVSRYSHSRGSRGTGAHTRQKPFPEEHTSNLPTSMGI